MPRLTRPILDTIYRKYNRKELVSPDPLQFLYEYPRKEDREIAALIASSLAYGRVAQILTSVSRVLEAAGPYLRDFILDNGDNHFRREFRNFKHRFTTGEEMSALFIGLKKILETHGSLESCFVSYLEQGAPSLLPAITAFTKEIRHASAMPASSLISDPSKGSACKRLHLFLRWMVREDSVDPGGWENIPPSMLIIPLDTHMHYFGTCYGFTSRKAADLKTALEITEGFSRLNSGDPVKYDFSLTRFGIRNDLCWDDLESMIK